RRSRRTTGGTRPRRSRRSPRTSSSASRRRSRARKRRSWRSDGGDRSHSLAAPRGRHHGRQRALGGAARPVAPAGAPRRQGVGAGGGRGQPAPRHPLPLALRLLHRELAPPAPRGRGATARRVRRGDLGPEQITAGTLARHLGTNGIPDPDLLIRTSGEMRLSNFFLWQLAYTEMYVTDTLWPDFRERDYLQALAF